MRRLSLRAADSSVHTIIKQVLFDTHHVRTESQEQILTSIRRRYPLRETRMEYLDEFEVGVIFKILNNSGQFRQYEVVDDWFREESLIVQANEIIGGLGT